MLKPAILLLGLAVAAGTAHAGGEARWFRYYDDRHQPVVTDTITPEHITHGYDELTQRMQLIRHVEGQRALTPEEQAAQRSKREQAAQRARDDKQLLRLYSGPGDAERARDRQLEALQVRIDFATNSLAGLKQRRAAEAQKAAVLERTGKPIPADLRQSIANYDKQIAASQTELSDRKAEQQKVKADFEPMIRRLAELTGRADPEATPAPAPGPAGAPAPNAAPAGAAAAKPAAAGAATSKPAR